MSRLSLLALALFALPAVTTRAAIVFHPDPYPSCGCNGNGAGYGNVAPYYQRQLDVLNRPYHHTYAPVDMPDFSHPPVTVDMLQTPCTDAPLYYRKADLMPHVVIERRTTAPVDKGQILIIPQRLLDRPLSSFAPAKRA